MKNIVTRIDAMSLAEEFLLDAIQADRAADRTRIRYVHDVRQVLARTDAAVLVRTPPSPFERLRALLRVRIPARRSTDRTTG
jgi:hypothetical protein